MTEADVLYLFFMFIVACTFYGFAFFVKRTGIAFLFTVLSAIVFFMLMLELQAEPLFVIVLVGVIMFQFASIYMLFKKGDNE